MFCEYLQPQYCYVASLYLHSLYACLHMELTFVLLFQDGYIILSKNLVIQRQEVQQLYNFFKDLLKSTQITDKLGTFWEGMYNLFFLYQVSRKISGPRILQGDFEALLNTFV